MPHYGSQHVLWYTCTVEKPYFEESRIRPWEVGIRLLLWPFTTTRSNRTPVIILVGGFLHGLDSPEIILEHLLMPSVFIQRLTNQN